MLGRDYEWISWIWYFIDIAVPQSKTKLSVDFVLVIVYWHAFHRNMTTLSVDNVCIVVNWHCGPSVGQNRWFITFFSKLIDNAVHLSKTGSFVDNIRIVAYWGCGASSMSSLWRTGPVFLSKVDQICYVWPVASPSYVTSPFFDSPVLISRWRFGLLCLSSTTSRHDGFLSLTPLRWWSVGDYRRLPGCFPTSQSIGLVRSTGLISFGESRLLRPNPSCPSSLSAVWSFF